MMGGIDARLVSANAIQTKRAAAWPVHANTVPEWMSFIPASSRPRVSAMISFAAPIWDKTTTKAPAIKKKTTMGPNETSASKHVAVRQQLGTHKTASKQQHQPAADCHSLWRDAKWQNIAPASEDANR